MIKCRCMDCGKRHPRCHAECEDYRQYRAEIDRKNEIVRKQTEETQYKVAHIPHAVQKGWYK